MAKRKKSRSMRVGDVRCTKNGRPYKKLKSGKVKFIKGSCPVGKRRG